MPRTVALNNVDHHDLAVRPALDAAAGEVVLFPPEFEEAARDYPLLLRRDEEGAWQAVALLGLEADENLFAATDGGWHARYVPAIVRRGPFSIGTAGEEPTIHVDLDDPRVRRGADATHVPLFLPRGGHAPYLDHVAEMLRVIHAGHAATAPVMAAWEAEGLIEPLTVQVALDETLRYDLTGFHTVGEEALARLDDAALGRLHRAGVLRLAFQLAGSLGNVRRLADLKRARR